MCFECDYDDTHDDPIPFDQMHHRLLLDDFSFAFKAVVLLAETTLEDCVSRQDLQKPKMSYKHDG